ncbi:MAG: radical SAM protein, partial [Desulforhabdus sp.]|nr:radical SAM protein [Desulforhabdus sp.]
MKQPGKPSDRWTERAFRNISRNLSAVRKPLTYRNLDRYKRAVVDLNRALEMSSQSTGARLSLANYQHLKLSPLESSNLLRAAENPAENQFYPYFSERLTAILRERKVRIIGFSLNFLSQALCTFAMLGFLRRNFPNVTLAAGGGLITSWMRRPGWANPFAGLIDHQVAGPGETFLLSLLGLNAD